MPLGIGFYPMQGACQVAGICTGVEKIFLPQPFPYLFAVSCNRL
jgi:hypothetical protein